MKRGSRTSKFYEAVTPIFNSERGERMKIVRMRLLMDQKRLGELLGVGQQVISDLERGNQATTRAPFTLARFLAIFAHHAEFILYGEGARFYNLARITKTYWELKQSREPEIRKSFGKSPVKYFEMDPLRRAKKEEEKP